MHVIDSTKSQKPHNATETDKSRHTNADSLSFSM